MFTVVGGSGFTGTRLCSLLEERGLDFEIVDLKRSGRFPDRTQIADIRDIKALREAVSGDMIVFTSTVAVYGFCKPETDESGDLNPFNDYGRSKLQAEGVLNEWHDEAPGVAAPYAH